jgi:hypothetical protein
MIIIRQHDIRTFNIKVTYNQENYLDGPEICNYHNPQFTSHEIINLAVGDVGILILHSYSQDFNLPTQHFKIFGRFYFIEF